MSLPTDVTIAVVIPAGSKERADMLTRLLEDVQRQTLQASEIEVVHGVSPNGHARNVGVARTQADVLIFMDDDVRLGCEDVFARLVDGLRVEGVGLVGTAQLLPDDSTNFQRSLAQQISRSSSPVVQTLTDSDMVTTQCCAITRRVLDQVGGFHGRILRGVDPELRDRVRKAGLRVAVVPEAWHYHPMPTDVRAMCRMAWRNGEASAFARRFFPETVLYNPEGHTARFEARPPFWRRLSRRGLGFLQRLGAGAYFGLLYDVIYALGYFRMSWRARNLKAPQ